MFEINWGDDEIEQLQTLYHEFSNQELSIKFGRTINSIQQKASRLNLHKSAETLRRVQSVCRNGEKSYNWKGGRKLSRRGYVLVLEKDNPASDSNGYILEHRLIMAQHIGREVTGREVVHHINGDKQDNRIENLLIMASGEHTTLHHTGSKRSDETCKNISNSKRRKYNE